MRPWEFTQETGSSSSMDCTLIWTFTTLSGGDAAGGSNSLLVLSPGSLRPMHWLSESFQQDQSLLYFEATATQLRCMKNNLWFCIYSILDILRGEARVLEGLHNLGIKGEHQGTLLKLPVNLVDDSYALDIRHPAIMVSPVQSYYFSGELFFLCALTPGCELVDQSSGYCNNCEPAKNLSY